jgi:hypothetical protein
MWHGALEVGSYVLGACLLTVVALAAEEGAGPPPASPGRSPAAPADPCPADAARPPEAQEEGKDAPSTPPKPAQDASARPPEAEEGWVHLFKESEWATLWHTKGNWSIDKAGVVTLTPRPGEGGWSRWASYLWSHKQYGDFEVRFDYRVEKRGNSGFYFRVTDKDNPVSQGLEVQIFDSYSRGPDAKPNDHDAGAALFVPPTKLAAKPPGEWNRFHILNKDNRITVTLNGVVVNEVEVDKTRYKGRPAVGWIGFQDHGLPVSLRDLRIRPR